MSEIVYALYHGDTFLDVGTADELAERRGVQRRSVLFLATKTHKERTDYENSTRAYRLEEDEDERMPD